MLFNVALSIIAERSACMPICGDRFNLKKLAIKHLSNNK